MFTWNFDAWFVLYSGFSFNTVYKFAYGYPSEKWISIVLLFFWGNVNFLCFFFSSSKAQLLIWVENYICHRGSAGTQTHLILSYAF